MKKIAIALATIVSLTTSTASANDLLKVLAALQGQPYQSRTNVRVRHEVVRPRYEVVTRRGVRDPYTGRGRVVPGARHPGELTPSEAARLRALERAEEQARQRRLAEIERIRHLRTERSRVHVRFGTQPQLPPLPHQGHIGSVRPPIVSPPIRRPVVRGHEFGEIVRCNVPLYHRLRIRDLHNIAPGARKMVVAMKAPGACQSACACCADEIVYVAVLAPRCDPQCVHVSPCGRRVRLDFGRYEIELTSTATHIRVDYDR